MKNQRTLKEQFRQGGIFALAISIPLFFVIGIFALIIVAIGIVLFLGSFADA